MSDGPLASSFRDPAGFLFTRGDRLYRQVNSSYRDDYDRLMTSGLYQALTADGSLVPHEDVEDVSPVTDDAYKIIQPTLVPFISYPYEWCFSQLRDAALLTLHVQQVAFEHGMTLKDCSMYNVQFLNGKPIFIDTLSFEAYREGDPWVPYRQFCQHFLAPLALMAYRDPRLNKLLAVHLDGIPLDLASKLLPLRSYFSPSLLAHLHLHARSGQAAPGVTKAAIQAKFSRQALLALLDDLATVVRGLRWEPRGTDWGDYYQDTNYTAEAFAHKQQAVAACIERVQPRIVWDLGANTGVFSRLASAQGCTTISFDYDPGVIERSYRQARKAGDTHLLPLILDLTNPSPGLGWMTQERLSLFQRGPADLVLALALIHHLAIGNNVPLQRLAAFFAQVGRVLLIEFVPLEDSQVQRMLAMRENIFTGYTRQAFEEAFQQEFDILDTLAIHDQDRTLYLMQRR
ncbi:MAG TPA: methyltransferase domain-containing protein [Armatimonadota bacterium]|jgi:hypothetical protein